MSTPPFISHFLLKHLVWLNTHSNTRFLSPLSYFDWFFSHLSSLSPPFVLLHSR
ncbi:hypothetical protein HanIR_Chr06g0259281 [Helianthus annuus]|nr:hypothetical protein HanIR_Chr06g0259281 [Helianthus annuus]